MLVINVSNNTVAVACARRQKKEKKKKKKEIAFIDKKKHKVTRIVSTKINSFINYQLLNGVVACEIRQETDSTWNY